MGERRVHPKEQKRLPTPVEIPDTLHGLIVNLRQEEALRIGDLEGGDFVRIGIVSWGEAVGVSITEVKNHIVLLTSRCRVDWSVAYQLSGTDIKFKVFKDRSRRPQIAFLVDAPRVQVLREELVFAKNQHVDINIEKV